MSELRLFESSDILEEDNFFRNILDEVYDGVYFVDPLRRITYWNKGAERITGFSALDVVGKFCQDNILMHVDCAGNNLCTTSCPLVGCMSEGCTQEAEIYLNHKAGHRIPVRIRSTPIRDSGGQIIGAMEVFADNSGNIATLERIRALEKLTYIDSLTEVGNRRYVEAFLNSKIEEMKRYHWPFGVLMVDIDRFKEINDTHGHSVGDEILKSVSKTLVRNVRYFDFVGRWAGDEFLAVILNVNEVNLMEIAEKIRNLVAKSRLTFGSSLVQVTVSIGGTMAKPKDTITSIIERADMLMYSSKQAKKNRTTFDFEVPNNGISAS